jgi:hypothetical protein
MTEKSSSAPSLPPIAKASKPKGFRQKGINTSSNYVREGFLDQGRKYTSRPKSDQD